MSLLTLFNDLIRIKKKSTNRKVNHFPKLAALIYHKVWIV